MKYNPNNITFDKVQENIDLMKIYKNNQEANLSGESDLANIYADLITFHSHNKYIEGSEYNIYFDRAEYLEDENIILSSHDLELNNGLYFRFYFKYDISIKKLETLIIKSVNYHSIYDF